LFGKLAVATSPVPKQAGIENKSQWQAIVMPNSQWNVWQTKTSNKTQVITNNEHSKTIHQFHDLQLIYTRATALNISSSVYSNLFSNEYATSKKWCVTSLPELIGQTLKSIISVTP
jgi:hypothetical protein